MSNPTSSIRQYCLKYGFGKTARLLPEEKSSENVELEDLFQETAKKKVDVMKSLGIVFKGNAERNALRKRIRNMEETHIETKQPKEDRKEKKTDWKEEDKIPEGFLKLLDSLALDRKDAEILFKKKDQWKFVKSDRKILCSEQGCKFETTLMVDCLRQHCISVHKWKVYPCPYDYCKFEAFSQRSYKTHVSSHRTISKCRSIENVCDRGNCGKRFGLRSDLQKHLKIHDNILLKCHFCPWTGVNSIPLVEHLNHHFDIRPYPCSFCDLKFFREEGRVSHERIIHENIPKVFKCGSCDFESTNFRKYKAHLESCDKRNL